MSRRLRVQTWGLYNKVLAALTAVTVVGTGRTVAAGGRTDAFSFSSCIFNRAGIREEIPGRRKIFFFRRAANFCEFLRIIYIEGKILVLVEMGRGSFLLSISNVFVYVHRTKEMMTAKHGRDGKENIGSGSG